MTLDDAKKIAAIIETADGGCPSCVHKQLEKVREAFPRFYWEYDAENYGEIKVYSKQPHAS